MEFLYTGKLPQKPNPPSGQSVCIDMSLPAEFLVAYSELLGKAGRVVGSFGTMQRVFLIDYGMGKVPLHRNVLEWVGE